jgi:hypothetical protein
MPLCFFVSDQEADCMDKTLTTERVLRALGVTGKLLGFRYTIYMIERVMESQDRILLITKSLYPETARHFGVTASSVERALRTLIHVCWERTDHSFLEHIAGTPLGRVPTNSEFLDIVAAYLKRMKQ